MKFPVTKNISIKPCKTQDQLCPVCGVFFTEKQMAISINNTGDNLRLRKNIWMHIKCVPMFKELVSRVVRKRGKEIIAEAL